MSALYDTSLQCSAKAAASTAMVEPVEQSVKGRAVGIADSTGQGGGVADDAARRSRSAQRDATHGSGPLEAVTRSRVWRGTWRWISRPRSGALMRSRWSKTRAGQAPDRTRHAASRQRPQRSVPTRVVQRASDAARGQALRASAATSQPFRDQRPSHVGRHVSRGRPSASSASVIVRRVVRHIRHIVRDVARVAHIVGIVSLGLGFLGEARRHVVSAAIVVRRRLDFRLVLRRELVERLGSGVMLDGAHGFVVADVGLVVDRIGVRLVMQLVLRLIVRPIIELGLLLVRLGLSVAGRRKRIVAVIELELMALIPLELELLELMALIVERAAVDVSGRRVARAGLPRPLRVARFAFGRPALEEVGRAGAVGK